MVMALDEAADVDVALVEQLPPPPAEGDEEDDEAEDEEGRIVVAVGMVPWRSYVLIVVLRGGTPCPQTPTRAESI